MNGAPHRWLGQSQYDLDTARAMLESRRYLYVVFCYQQAVEKGLKAVIAHRTNEFPPRSHQLLRLAEVASLEVADERATFLRELSAYYTQSRYPDEAGVVGAGLSEAQAARVLAQTEEVIEWLRSML